MSHKTQIAASQILEQMSDEDRASFTRAGWREGVAAMLVDEWASLDLEAVLAAIEEQIEATAKASAVHRYGTDPQGALESE